MCAHVHACMDAPIIPWSFLLKKKVSWSSTFSKVTQNSVSSIIIFSKCPMKSTAFALDGWKNRKSTKMSSVKSFRTQDDLKSEYSKPYS